MKVEIKLTQFQARHMDVMLRSRYGGVGRSLSSLIKSAALHEVANQACQEAAEAIKKLIKEGANEKVET